MKYFEESIRPWGRYQKFFQDEKIWIKYLQVTPQSRLSLQKHQYRSEKWIIVDGQGLAVIEDKTVKVGPGSVVDIPLGAVHRMCNPSGSTLTFIEVAFGESLTEEDIIRLEDDYHRIDMDESNLKFISG
ncbi:MAG: phosphomannose isomerase type II C-terminal cupin domain [Candidatus Omnitrophica bacterium]|nr:phosphomannose isomerase type II C-terminal cupin domain [Candidatus Omnitrophota bacterium]MDE2222079.1 phosphomannose isomerase type II C-terminal cupin domain [Candidatus Omnitrophota bacterium]